MKLFQKLINLLKLFKSTQTKSRLSGKEIDLTSDNISISSNNFSVDNEGNIVIQGEEANSIMKIYLTSDKTRYLDIRGARISFINGTYGHEIMLFNASNGAWMQLNSGSKSIRMLNDGNEFTRISITDLIDETIIEATGITTPTVAQTSKESKKKNITKYNEKALDIVKDSEIYKYNFKSEDDKHKKHIGFVIGDEGGKYKTPEQVISNDREGIESYSMTSILWKAIQEQQQLIEQLQKEIKELKESE